MDPNDRKKKPTDEEIKEAAKKARSTGRPGVVSSSEAAALDQRIAEKTRGSKPAPSELDQLEQDVSSKQKNTPGMAAASPGAFASQPRAATARSDLSDFESDVAAKQRARSPVAAGVSARDRKAEAKMAAAGGSRELKNLEASVQAKMSANGVGSQPARREGAEYDHNSRVADSTRTTQRDDLSRLDERIAAKNASAVVPRSLQEAEDIVTRKKTNGATHGGTVISPHEKGAPEQNPQQAKDDMGMEVHPQGLQPHDDVEYGEYGGPTEQGLAIAFAVEEETDDAFIPAAIEYDPDAKPPLIKNRRFRLYAFLAIICVLVGTISAAVGITLAGKKTKYDISERDTIGIRETIERIVGAEKLEDRTGPYFKAMDWIQYHDPKQVTPSEEFFIQRFVAVLFYFSTSQKREWDGGCAPAVEGETEDCVFVSLVEVLPDEAEDATQLIPWVRWLSSADECAWAGIQCSEDGHIRSIELSGANLTGTIPDELVQLNFLQSFTVKYNDLTGTLPENLLKLRHLVDLNLFGNDFTGTIPDSFFSSPILQRLNLSFNHLNGTISTAVGEMVDAKALYLSFNDLDGTIPTEIGRLHSLVSLWLHRNNLIGTIPTEIGNLAHVEDLLMNRNMLTGEIPSEIVEMSSLGDFKVSDNQLRGTLSEEFYNLKFLYTLDLFRNQFSGTLSSNIEKLTNLDNLRIQFNEFTGALPTELGALSRLDNVQVFGNKFNGTVPEELCPAQRAALQLNPIPRIVSDCLPDDDGSPPEIECSCCSNCCDRETLQCVKVE